jgi:hypothetical protein
MAAAKLIRANPVNELATTSAEVKRVVNMTFPIL